MAGVTSLRIHLLGGFRVIVGSEEDTPIVWRQPRAAAVVKLLALAPGHKLHREQLLDLLWPELDAAAAGNNLNYTLYVARRVLEPEPGVPRHLLQWQGDSLTLAVDADVWVDVDAFEREAQRARHAPTAVALQRAIDLYTGDLLPEDIYEDWAFGPRERLRAARVSLLTELAVVQEAAGNLPDAMATHERIVQLDPAHEEASVRLMLLYARSGQRHRALRRYQRLRDALVDELDAAPDATTQQLYGEILAGRFNQTVTWPERDIPAPAPQHNLSAPLTRFIGREDEIRRVLDALADSRLLTLTGAGGVGKTRLAIATAETMVANYPDGVWFVELGSLTVSHEIPIAIAGALGITLGAERDDVAGLSAALQQRSVLLVLDNCEHIVDGCARLAEQLLQRCQGLRILATSREPLRVPGEVVLRVPALQIPEARSDVARIAGSEAVQLFLDRAQSVQSDLSLSPSDLPAVADICRRLDGLPFAIELAAARMPVLSTEQLMRLLENPLQVLTGGSRTAGARQQTLRATLDWSFGLLEPPEQRLLARLSIFAGGWNLESAERVCSDDEVDGRDVLGLLAQLVDKSLVEARSGSGEARYRLLETVRQYADERLRTEGEDRTVAERHASHMLELAEAAEPELGGGNQTHWLERLDLDLDNLRSALRWLEQSSDVERMLRLAAALVRMWWIRGYANEGRRWLETGLAMVEHGAAGHPGVRAKALQAAGNLARMQGDVVLAQHHLEACLTIQRERGQPAEIADALDYLAALLVVCGDAPRARQLAEEGLALRRELSDPRAVAMSLGTLGELAFSVGECEVSSAYIEESLMLYRSIGDRHSTAIALNNLGEALRGQERLNDAEARFRESLDLFRELDALHGVAYLHANLGDIARRQGRIQTALGHYLEALTGFLDLGYTQAALGVVCGLAGIEAIHGSPEQAVRLFGAEAALRGAAGFALAPYESADHDRSIAAARARMSDASFTESWARGQSLTFDEAVQDARTLSAIGRYTRRDDEPVSLSPREHEVGLLLARGLTNREIATELQTGVRTVDKHVSNILHKLELASRTQVREWMADRGLLGDRG